MAKGDLKDGISAGSGKSILQGAIRVQDELIRLEGR